MSVADQPAQERRVEALAAEPHARPLGSPRLWFKVHVLERVKSAVKAGRSVSPQNVPRCELLIEQSASLSERNSESVVLVLVPADSRLDDQTTF